MAQRNSETGRRLQIELKSRYQQPCGNRQKSHGVPSIARGVVQTGLNLPIILWRLTRNHTARRCPVLDCRQRDYSTSWMLFLSRRQGNLN